MSNLFLSLEGSRENFMSDVYNTLEFLPTNIEANRIIDSFDRVLEEEELITAYSMAYNFAEWVANEIFSDNWEFNKNSFEEIACRKLVKLGIVEEVDGQYRLKSDKKSEHQKAKTIEVLSKPTKINLNDTIKVKLTDYGKEIYYHQFDELNNCFKRKGCKLIEPKMPEVDKEGKTRFQLWSFMEMYGNYIGLTKPNFIDPIEIEIGEE